MKFDRKKFWDNYKIQFGSIGEKEQGIVPGVELLLKGFETYYGWWADVRHIAYALATTKLETAHTYHPVREAYWLSENWRKNNLRYYPWYGRGYVQLTWKRNYEVMNEKLPKHFPEFIKQFEKASGKKFNLMDADQVMHPAIAFGIMTVGMFQGSFTGKAFKHYINDSKTDYVEARRIINGTDKQNTIAGYAVKFEKVLRASLVEKFSDLQDGELLDIPNQIEEFEPIHDQVDDIPAVDQLNTNQATAPEHDQPTEADVKQSTPSANESVQTLPTLPTLENLTNKFDQINNVATEVQTRSDSVKSMWTFISQFISQPLFAIGAWFAGIPTQVWIVVAGAIFIIAMVYLFRQIYLGGKREDKEIVALKNNDLWANVPIETQMQVLRMMQGK